MNTIKFKYNFHNGKIYYRCITGPDRGYLMDNLIFSKVFASSHVDDLIAELNHINATVICCSEQVSQGSSTEIWALPSTI